MMSLAEDSSGDVWAGANCGGVNRLRAGRPALFRPSAGPNPGGCVFPVLHTRDGSIWAGSWGGGLFRIRGRQVSAYGVRQGLADLVVLALHEDSSGGLWIGGYSSLTHYSGGVFTAQSQPGSATLQHITAIVGDGQRGLWIGSNSTGLMHFDPATGVTTPQGDQAGLPGKHIRTLYLDGHGTLWIGTSGNGLVWRRDGRFLRFDTSAGLADDNIAQIVEDGRGSVWICSHRGISRLERNELEDFAAGRIRRLHPQHFDRTDGMKAVQCTGGFHPAGLRARDGKLWFSTVGGLVIVDPANIARNTLPPAVHIEEVAWAGGRRAGPFGGSLRLGPGMRNLEIHYTATSLVDASKVRFRYRLEGLDPEWVEAAGRRTAYYSSAPPGEYVFRVAAANNDGVWNETGAALPLRVAAHFWETVWFRGAVAMALALALAWTVRTVSGRRLRRRLADLEMQQTVSRERTRIARDMHDELGSLLIRISLLADRGAPLDSVSQAAREAVRSMDELVWTVSPGNDTLENVVSYICRSAERFLAAAGIRCRLDVPMELPSHTVPSDRRRHLLLAAKEAFNNIAKHSGASEVWMRVQIAQNALTLEIEDNGRGFDPAAAPAERHGLKNMTDRMAAAGGEFQVESTSGRGTTVRLRVLL
jgi:signal transduction histidine kinase